MIQAPRVVNDGFALLFPGQGSSFPGMGADLHEASEVVRDCIGSCSETSGIDLAAAMFDRESSALEDPWISQLALFSLSIAIGAHLTSFGVQPIAVAGHSLGEYAALVFAGCLSRDEGVRLVSLRGQVMARAARKHPGMMAAVIGLSPADVEELCEAARDSGTVVAANYNSVKQTVVSGDETAVGTVIARVRERGGAAVPLPVPGAFHSPLMAEAEQELGRTLASVAFARGTCVVVSSVTGQVMSHPEEYRSWLLGQITGPVRWSEAVATILKLNPSALVETGPGTVLAGLLRAQAPGRQVPSLGTWSAISAFLTGRQKDVVKG